MTSFVSGTTLPRLMAMPSSDETQPGRAIFLLKPLSKNLCPNDINALLNREWASRAWTFQEMVLASHPVFLCGGHSLSWSCLLNVLSMTPRKLNAQFGGFLSSKLQIDRSPGSSFQRWQKMAHVWLLFPRPVHPSLAVAQSAVLCDDNMVSPKTSFLERTTRWQLHKRIQRRRPVLISMALLSTLALVALSCWGGTTYVLVKMVMICGRLGKTGEGMILCLALLLFWLLFIFVAILVRQPIRVVLGMQRRGLVKSYVATEGQTASLMSGIHVALRDRVIQRPHDRAFALGGILSILGVPLPKPSYQDSVGQAYQALMSRLIAWDPCCTAMLVDAGYPALPGAPSWVPNWSRRPPSHWLSSWYIAGDTDKVVFPDRRDISRPSVDAGKLKILGKPHGVVTFRTSPLAVDPRRLPGVERAGETRISAMASFLSWTQQPFRVVESRAERRDLPESYLYAVLRGISPVWVEHHHLRAEGWLEAGELTLRKGGNLPTWEAPHGSFNDDDDFKLFRKLYHRSLKKVDAIPRETNVAESNVQGIQRKLRVVRGGAALLNRLIKQVAADERCLFSLSSGLLGSGPLAMEVGDEVFLLKGVPIPMVLRKSETEDAFVIIGAAFVHGLMDGEGDNSAAEIITII